MLELITIGHSYEGQPIKMAKISKGLNKDGERKSAIWIDAGEFFLSNNKANMFFTNKTINKFNYKNVSSR